MLRVFLICMLILSFAKGGFGEIYQEYADDYCQLIGKQITIHGPFCWDTLGVARNRRTCAFLIDVLDLGDEVTYNAIIHALPYSLQIMRTDKNTKAIVTEVELFERRAKVILLEGYYRGMSGWVPLEWLQGNQKRPRLSDEAKPFGERLEERIRL